MSSMSNLSESEICRYNCRLVSVGNASKQLSMAHKLRGNQQMIWGSTPCRTSW